MSNSNSKLAEEAEDLDSLAFFHLVGEEDDVDLGQEDPNANIAPDILRDDDELDTPPLPPQPPKAPVQADPNIDPQLQVQPPTPPAAPTPPDPSDEDDDDGDEDPLQNGSTDGDPDFNPFQEFGKALVKGGLLELGEDQDVEKLEWNQETFTEVLESTVESKAFQYIENLARENHGEEGIELIKDILINGVSIPQYLSKYQQQVDLENLDMTAEPNKIAVMKEYLMRTGVDEEEANDRIQFAVDNDKLDDYAGKYHQKLVMISKKEREQMVQQQQQRKEQQEMFENQRRDSYRKILNEAVKAGEIEGYPVTNKDATELLNFVDQKAYTLPNGQKISSFEYKLAKLRHEDPKKFLAFAKLLQADLDLSPVKRSAVTKETNDIFTDLQAKSKRTSTRTGAPKSSMNSFEKYFLGKK